MATPSKNVQWSAEETQRLLCIWCSPEFQEKLESSTRKERLYSELVEYLAKAGYFRSKEQVINKLKKLKKEYRDSKKVLSRNGPARNNWSAYYNILDGVLGKRPAIEMTGALNSATATLEPSNPASPSTSAINDDLSDISEHSSSTTTEVSETGPESIVVVKQEEIPEVHEQHMKRGKKKRRQDIEDILDYMERADARAEEREERMLLHMQQSTANLLGLVERMVTAIEGVVNTSQTQEQ
ncbi:zinc finger protein with KRAB and SCAN domains 2-like [Trichomycterus rosablanca]|uniref:zinc finger protein with KRAB and SCAN domains 2-like n=1 Tax=Trichomycterus rosablanca TaxID=2290929 RepID=UPI002F3592F8